MEDAYLIHHGIKGQRWGIRRYQNEDGTLTNAGKKRYSVESKVTEHEENLYGMKLRVKNTQHNISSSAGTANSKAKIDSLAKKQDYDSADEFDSKASRVISEYEKNGKEKALELLDKEFSDYSYKMMIDEDEYVDYGEKMTTYYLAVYGNDYIYVTSGDRDYSDDQAFMKKPK